MQRQHSLIGLLAIGLLIHTANADISLTLRNANSARGSGPAYLPPPVQNVPISDDYYNGAQQHHQHQQQQQQQQSTFKESNFGDSKYHIFEVHNHFEPGSAPQPHAPSQAHFAAPAYLPPPAREIHIQHVNAPAGVNDELDVSLLSFAAAGVGNVAHGQQQQITIASSAANPFPSNYNHDLSPQQNARRSKLLGESVHKSNANLPSAPSNPVTQHIRVENYRVTQQQNHVTAGVSDARQSNFKAAEYLPPAAAVPIQQQQQQQHQGEQLASGVQQPFKGADYLPPQSASLTHNQASSQVQVQSYGSQARQLHPTATPDAYHAPEYLPPQGGQQQAQLVGGQVDAQHQQQQQQQYQQPQSPFQGPQYLPPQRENTQSAYSAPDYLPPPQAANAVELPQQQQTQQQSYATPSAAAGPAQSHLPPGYDFTNPEQQQQQQQSQTQPIQNALPLPAPQPKAIPRPTQSSGNLPPGYEFNRPDNAEQAIAELHGLQLQQQSQQQQEQPIEQQPVQQQQQPVSVQPQAQAPPAVIYGHQTQPQPEQQLPQLAPTTAYVASSADSALQSGVAANQQAQSNYQSQQANVQQLVEYNGNNDQQQYSAPGYRPPTTAPAPAAPPVTVASHIHSLSSYMTTVQPFERYGAARFTEPRKPFPEYGPPPGAAKYQPVQQYQQQQQQQQQQLEQYQHAGAAALPQPAPAVAPMYHEQATRPQHYAPAMSYQTSNAEVLQQTFHGSQQKQQHQHQFQSPAAPDAVAAAGVGYTLNAQTKQSLQRLMPKEIHLSSQNYHQQPQVHHQQQQQQQQHQQHHIVASTAQASAIAVAALPAAALPAAGKIRTVQIINPHAEVKTLKVLETSDHAGVKTIKILGASDASPMGQHRIIKVVSQNAHNALESHVQTVKIFDDQEGGSVAVGAASGSAYLPPRPRRSTRTSDKSSAKNKHRRHSKNSSAARGRQHRRY